MKSILIYEIKRIDKIQVEENKIKHNTIQLSQNNLVKNLDRGLYFTEYGLLETSEAATFIVVKDSRLNREIINMNIDMKELEHKNNELLKRIKHVEKMEDIEQINKNLAEQIRDLLQKIERLEEDLNSCEEREANCVELLRTVNKGKERLNKDLEYLTKSLDIYKMQNEYYKKENKRLRKKLKRCKRM